MTDIAIFGKAISDHTRLEIMNHLCCVWLNVTDLVEKLDGRVNQPTVSHHLKMLEEAGLVFVRQDGRQRFYTLNVNEYNACCGQLFRRGNPGMDIQIVPVISVDDISGGVR